MSLFLVSHIFAPEILLNALLLLLTTHSLMLQLLHIDEHSDYGIVNVNAEPCLSLDSCLTPS